MSLLPPIRLPVTNVDKAKRYLIKKMDPLLFFIIKSGVSRKFFIRIGEDDFEDVGKILPRPLRGLPCGKR